MKVLASVKKICRKCKIIRRNGVVRVICADRATSSGRGNRYQVTGIRYRQGRESRVVDS